jgi:hypothetical protein
MKNYEKNKVLFEQNDRFIYQSNLMEYMEKIGFSFVKTGMKNGHPSYETNGSYGKIQVFRNNAAYKGDWAFVQHPGNIGGNIKNFFYQVLRCQGTTSEIMAYMLKELSSPNPAKIDVLNSMVDLPGSIVQSSSDFTVAPLTQNQFLASRGLDTDLLKQPKYRASVFNKLTMAAANNGKSISFYNTAFPVKSATNEILGFQLYNKPSIGKPSKLFSEGMKKSEGVWLSSNRQPNFPLIIAESPLDTISYTKLHPALINSSNDLAFLGRMDREGVQMGVIQDHIAALKPSKIVLVNDNDIAGLGYDIDLLCNLKKPTLDNPFLHLLMKHKAVKNESDLARDYARVIIEISPDCPSNKIDESRKLTESIYTNFEKKFKANQQYNLIKQQDNSFSFDYPVDTETRKEIVNFFVTDIYKEYPFFSIDKVDVGYKDWNEKLMDTLGLEKESIARNYNPYLTFPAEKARSNWLNDVNTIDLSLKKKTEQIFEANAEKEI